MLEAADALNVKEVRAGYGGADVLHDVSLTVRKGTIHTLVGVNGAGKTTLLRLISGVEPMRGGTVEMHGADITDASPAQRVRRGLGHVPEGRRVFPNLSIRDNIRLGAVSSRIPRREFVEERDRLLTHFPVLAKRERQYAGSLSGGEQQMLAIAMALISKPSLLMLDEPSLGLAPIIVDQVFAEIESLRRSGTTILLVEQFALRALALADDATVLRLGRVVASGPAAAIREDDNLHAAYLGS